MNTQNTAPPPCAVDTGGTTHPTTPPVSHCIEIADARFAVRMEEMEKMMERIALAEPDGILYDVVEVDIDSRKVHLMGKGKDAPNADAIMRFAIMRRATEFNFFDVVPAGTYSDGDTYR